MRTSWVGAMTGKVPQKWGEQKGKKDDVERRWSLDGDRSGVADVRLDSTPPSPHRMTRADNTEKRFSAQGRCLSCSSQGYNRATLPSLSAIASFGFLVGAQKTPATFEYELGKALLCWS